jgi:hypothetical protein
MRPIAADNDLWRTDVVWRSLTGRGTDLSLHLPDITSSIGCPRRSLRDPPAWARSARRRARFQREGNASIRRRDALQGAGPGDGDHPCGPGMTCVESV